MSRRRRRRRLRRQSISGNLIQNAHDRVCLCVRVCVRACAQSVFVYVRACVRVRWASVDTYVYICWKLSSLCDSIVCERVFICILYYVNVYYRVFLGNRLKLQSVACAACVVIRVHVVLYTHTAHGVMCVCMYRMLAAKTCFHVYAFNRSIDMRLRVGRACTHWRMRG